jgi:hypothetical protein
MAANELARLGTSCCGYLIHECRQLLKRTSVDTNTTQEWMRRVNRSHFGTRLSWRPAVVVLPQMDHSRLFSKRTIKHPLFTAEKHAVIRLFTQFTFDDSSRIIHPKWTKLIAASLHLSPWKVTFLWMVYTFYIYKFIQSNHQSEGCKPVFIISLQHLQYAFILNIIYVMWETMELLSIKVLSSMMQEFQTYHVIGKPLEESFIAVFHSEC